MTEISKIRNCLVAEFDSIIQQFLFPENVLAVEMRKA